MERSLARRLFGPQSSKVTTVAHTISEDLSKSEESIIAARLRALQPRCPPKAIGKRHREEDKQKFEAERSPRKRRPKPRPMTPRESPEPHNALRINTADIHYNKVVDIDRLRSIYEARRAQFWTTIATDYGTDVTPAQLEGIWRNGSNAVRSPTPLSLGGAEERHSLCSDSLLHPSNSSSDHQGVRQEKKRKKDNEKQNAANSIESDLRAPSLESLLELIKTDPAQEAA